MNYYYVVIKGNKIFGDEKMPYEEYIYFDYKDKAEEFMSTYSNSDDMEVELLNQSSFVKQYGKEGLERAEWYLDRNE